MKWRRAGVALVLGVSCLALVGCGKVASITGSSSSDAGGQTAQISGTVVVSSEDLAKIGQSSVSSIQTAAVVQQLGTSFLKGLSDPTVLTSGTAYLYEIGTDGTVTYAGVSANVVNGQYTFNTVTTGKKYIVRVIATGQDPSGVSNQLDQECYVDVAVADTVVSGNISSKTKSIANYILEKVIKVSGTTYSHEFSSRLEEKALTVINAGLEDGTIAAPVAVQPVASISADITDRASLSDTERANIEAMDNDDTLRRTCEQSQIDAKVKKGTLTLDEAKIIIRAIFNAPAGGGAKDGGSSGAPPDFFIEQFAQAYVNGTTVSISDFATAFHASITSSTVNAYWTADRVATLMMDVVNTANSTLSQLYAAYDVNGDLSSFAKAAPAVFPSATRWTLPVTTNQQMNVAQTIILMMSAGLIDGSSLPNEIRSQLPQNQGPPFNPFALLKAIQFVNLQADQVYITETRVAPVKAWRRISTNNYVPTDALDVQIMVYSEASQQTVDHVILEYPTQSGTATASLTVEAVQGGGNSLSIASSGGKSGSRALAIKAEQQWTSARTASQVAAYNQAVNKSGQNKVRTQSGGFQQGWRLSPWAQNPNEGVFVSDFISGTANIKVYNSSNELLATASAKIIRLTLEPITWINPTGMDMAKVQERGWDQDFVPMTMPVDDVRGTVSPLLRWDTPSGSIPSGYYLAYAVNVGLSQSKADWNNQDPLPSVAGVTSWDYSGNGYRFKNIWSSWQDNRFIRSNTIQLKQALATTTDNATYRTTYEVNVTPLLVDERTGTVVWQGTNSQSNFNVGSSNVWSINLTGTVRFSSGMPNVLPRNSSGNVVAGQWKIGLFPMGQMGAGGTWTELFFTNGAKSPIGSDALHQIATLGTMADITGNGNVVTFSLPTFNKTDAIITKNVNYQVVVWYDVSETPAGMGWGQYGSPSANAVDIARYSYLEFFEMSSFQIRLDQGAVRGNDWRTGKMFNLVAEPSKQTLTLRVGDYINGAPPNSKSTSGQSVRKW